MSIDWNYVSFFLNVVLYILKLGITDKRGFRYTRTCHVAIATQNLQHLAILVYVHIIIMDILGCRNKNNDFSLPVSLYHHPNKHNMLIECCFDVWSMLQMVVTVQH